LLRADLLGCYIWREDKLAFDEVQNIKEACLVQSAAPIIIPLPHQNEILFPYHAGNGLWEATKDGLSVTQCDAGVSLLVNPININPFAYDFIDITATINPSVAAGRATIFWQGVNARDRQWSAIKFEPLEQGQTSDHYRIALSRDWRWFTDGAIKRIGIQMPVTHSMIIKNISIVSDTHIVPKLTLVEQQADNTGVYPVGRKGLLLQVDASQVDDCANVKLEFSKPNYFFDNLSGASRDAVLTSMIVDGTASKSVINSQLFPDSAYYQIRAIAINKDGGNQGAWSDPVTIQFYAAGQ
jgi:hypothetical protein